MMDKTIKINLAGILFQIDEEAYKLLHDYLLSINARFRNVPDGNETIDDIEARIAEIFQSQKGISGIISKENVEAMKNIIGKPEDFEHGESIPESPWVGTHMRRLYRNPEDSIISGVAGGIGAYLNFNPVWIRVLFILFTVFYGIGFFVYIALWIALPNAVNDVQKRELYGENYNTRTIRHARERKSSSTSSPDYQHVNNKVNAVGNAFNEIFRAIGKFFFIFMRIILIIVGISFVLAGFASLLTFILAFFFKYPGFFFDKSIDTGLFYLPDFLRLFISPVLVPWIMAFAFIIVALPLLALVYWGLKMIFWFRVRDWVLSLVALVLWVLSISALVILLFNQGISFNEFGRKTEQIILQIPSDTLYLKVDKKVSGLKFEKEISIPGGHFSLYINGKDNELYSRPRFRIRDAEDLSAKIEVSRYSNGKTRREAVEKAESLIYNYRVSNDTIYIDEYYKIPTTYKWTGAYVDINLFMPEGTVIWLDKDSEDLFHEYYDNIGNGIYSGENVGKYRIWTEKGLEEKVPAKTK
jgi:phage shock protein PspC (stress-responsive transcriptional regulator)